jgi:hypothetical protein
MGGGDLLNLLIERDTFPEDFTRFYVAEVQRLLPVTGWNADFLFFVDDASCRVVSQIWFHTS